MNLGNNFSISSFGAVSTERMRAHSTISAIVNNKIWWKKRNHKIELKLILIFV
jgi:hypothetical protein